MGLPAHAGLTFDITYTASVTSLSDFTNGNIPNAVAFVENQFSSIYSDNVTLNFTIGTVSSGLGQSLFSNAFFQGTYTQIKNALSADATSAADLSSVAALPASDPNNETARFGSADWTATSADAKALGLLAGNNAASDGEYDFNPGQTYTFDPLNRAVPGAFDFIGVTEHEFSELMGRTTQIGNPNFPNMVFDLSRFTATGVRSFADTGNGVYFSVNNGATNLKNYNPAAQPGGGDIQDWDLSDPTDPYNEATPPDQAHVLSAVDIKALDVIGWNLQSAVPEPSQFLPVASALGWFLVRRKRG
jgi:hypothetical protein